MSEIKLAQFQRAAVRHIVARLRDAKGSRRMLLADEVGLGKTVVAQGVIQSLLKGRKAPLKVIYLCSNAEIAEQNRTKLDPDSRKPIGRVTELAVERRDSSADLLLYSFTPGTSLKEGTGLAWERRLMLYLFHRIYGAPVGSKAWRQYFQCGAGDESWNKGTTLGVLRQEFERKTSLAFQDDLAGAWRSALLDEEPAISVVQNTVAQFELDDPAARSERNRAISVLRGVMQRVALRHVNPELVILDEVQRFRDVLDEAENPQHIARELFASGAPVLILSATPYRALTLAHEVAGGISSHYEDFFTTLDFLFGADKVTPARIRGSLAEFGERLRHPGLGEELDTRLFELKRELEADLTKVICRTERNWYLLDRRKGIDEADITGEAMPSTGELEEFFLLHKTLQSHTTAGQITEFWKSAPSLLTFLDAQYQVFRAINGKVKVPRALVCPPTEVKSLASRNHRISRLVELALGADEAPPPLWAAPTYTYYRNQYYGAKRPRKVLVFSGWRFVPKAVAIVASRVASDRLDDTDEASQPVRFTEHWSFHVFDLCFPSPLLAKVGHEAYLLVRQHDLPSAEDVVSAAEDLLRHELQRAGVEVVANGGHRAWQVVMRLEELAGRARAIIDALQQCISEEEESAEHLMRHVESVGQWVDDSRTKLQLSEARLKRLALVTAFSPAICVLRACESVYGSEATMGALPDIAKLCFGSMRRYFNRPLVQQVIRQHRFRMRWRQPSQDKGYVERALVYSADAHFQAVLDEYFYLLRHAGPADTAEKALSQIGDVWQLSQGNPRTNAARGRGDEVHLDENAEVHSAHFALAFGEDVSRDAGPSGDQPKMRKSIVREAFNSPFWPFVLATTSVGQEGLDFHLYCGDVFHWNLPSNPVDLEQREGRINRRDCLSVRESIAIDWPIGVVDRPGRNPWPALFDVIEHADDLQKYKHGLFPHWVYECRDPANTVRIRRHVPFFSTSRDAAKYERLKVGLALYRLVFGQANQEDLLENLQHQIRGLASEASDMKLRRLASYMLNLSPIGRQAAAQHALDEADALIQELSPYPGLKKLLRDVRGLQLDRPSDLAVAAAEISSLVSQVEEAIAVGDVHTPDTRTAVSALAYLRNPYDHIFDFQVEGGFVDDLAVIHEAWMSIHGSARKAGTKQPVRPKPLVL